MKKIFILSILALFMWVAPESHAQNTATSIPGDATEAIEQSGGNTHSPNANGTSATGFRPTNGVGGGSGTKFSAELTFLETLLSSKYVVAISLIIAIIGFFQFIIHGNGFGIIMIILAVALSSFPGMYKSFYSGVRPFVHSAAGTDQTQPWR